MTHTSLLQHTTVLTVVKLGNVPVCPSSLHWNAPLPPGRPNSLITWWEPSSSLCCDYILSVFHSSADHWGWCKADDREQECMISVNVNIPSMVIRLYDDFLFQDGISGWLCEEMSGEGLSLDQMDVSGLLDSSTAAGRSNNCESQGTHLST